LESGLRVRGVPGFSLNGWRAPTLPRLPIAREAESGEAEQHHRPWGGLRHDQTNKRRAKDLVLHSQWPKFVGPGTSTLVRGKERRGVGPVLEPTNNIFGNIQRKEIFVSPLK